MSAAVLAEVDALARRGRLPQALRLLREHPELPASQTRRRVARLRALAPAARRRAGRPEPAPRKLLIVDATTRCNQACVYCFEKSARFTRPDLGLDEVRVLLEKARGDGFTHVNFIGGEITLVPWLADAARLIRKLGMGAGLVTNGLALGSRRAAEGLARAGIEWVELSFLSSDPEVDFKTGGVRRGLELRLKAIENLRALKAAGGFSWGVNIVVTAYNREGLRRTLETALRGEPDLAMLKGVHIADDIAEAAVVPRFEDLRAPLEEAMRLLDERGTPFLFEDVPLCFVRPEYWLDQPVREDTGGVGFSYRGEPGAPDFAIFAGRDGAGLPACASCAVEALCCLPSKRYVALHGAGAFVAPRPPQP